MARGAWRGCRRDKGGGNRQEEGPGDGQEGGGGRRSGGGGLGWHGADLHVQGHWEAPWHPHHGTMGAKREVWALPSRGAPGEQHGGGGAVPSGPAGVCPAVHRWPSEANQGRGLCGLWPELREAHGARAPLWACMNVCMHVWEVHCRFQSLLTLSPCGQSPHPLRGERRGGWGPTLVSGETPGLFPLHSVGSPVPHRPFCNPVGQGSHLIT